MKLHFTELIFGWNSGNVWEIHTVLYSASKILFTPTFSVLSKIHVCYHNKNSTSFQAIRLEITKTKIRYLFFSLEKRRNSFFTSPKLSKMNSFFPTGKTFQVTLKIYSQIKSRIRVNFSSFNHPLALFVKISSTPICHIRNSSNIFTLSSTIQDIFLFSAKKIKSYGW